MSMSASFHDEPSKDFRQRYRLPEHFVWDEYDYGMIQYRGYLSIVFKLLPAPPVTVLDVGCGDGWVIKELTTRGYHAVGIDYNDRAIGFARVLAPEGKYRVGDVRALNECTDWDEAFDAATCIEVIEHIPPEYHVQVLSGIHQCLALDGKLVLTAPSVNLHLNRWHYKHFTLDELNGLMEGSGFQINHVVFQQKMSWLSSPFLWRVLQNKYYDLRIVRCILGKLLLSRYNIAESEKDAGRFVVLARKGEK